MNGVDVSRLQVGDTIVLDRQRAQMMIESGWAEQVDEPSITNPVVLKRPQHASS
jgi:RNA-binding protein YlmH